MELWIRSQDKELLVKAKGFELQYTRYDEGCQIFAVWQNNYQCVGKYKSKKRALEILDEIQNLLQPKVFIEQPEIDFKAADMIEKLSQNIILNTTTKMNAELKNVGQMVYEMPEE